MSNPHPTLTRELTNQDLGTYLDMIQKKVDHYKLEDLINPSDYTKDQIKKLDTMAVEAMAKFHNQ